MIDERGEGLKFLRRTRHVASIVTLVVMAGSCAWAASQLPRQSRSTQVDVGDDATTNQTGDQTTNANRPQPPATGNNTSGGDAPRNSGGADPQEPPPATKAEQSIANLTAALAALAFVQTLIFVSQLWSTHRVERAYVHIRDIASFDHVGTNNKPYLAVKLRNSGRTPARIHSYNAGYMVRDPK